MSKKDLLERVTRDSRRGATARREDAPARTPSSEEQTRVSRRVVRRRKSAPASEDVKPKTIRRRAVVEPDPAKIMKVEEETPTAAEETPPAEAPDPTPEPTELEVQAAPVEAPPEPEPEPEAKVEVAPEPEEAAAAAAPETEPEAPAPEAVAAKETSDKEAPAKDAPEAKTGEESGKTRTQFKGLGKAVVMPPPGYDPSNPMAFRRRQEAQAQREPTPTGDRWRGQGGSPASGATGGDRPRRGRRSATPQSGRFDQRPQQGRRRNKRRRSSGPKQASPTPAAHKRKVRVDHVISVGQLAHELGLKASVVIRTLLDMGQMATITEMLDIDTATLIAQEFEYEVENVGFIETDYLQSVEEEEEEGELEGRPPVVTIMGHVDHGKTTLIDSLRSSRVTQGEAGGITQHIGAYQVKSETGTITFLDTPGHQAFTAMRARGAGVTDLVILVVAADDGVQPQTIEAINHARAAEVPIVVAINKMDKPGVTSESIMTRMGEFGLVPEEWGGDTMMVPISALRGDGLDTLLEGVLLQAEVLDLRANSDRHGEGTVIEAKMERGKGAVATVLVQQGTLKRGDHVVLGSSFGKVRAMIGHGGKRVKSAGPSDPVELFGLSELPMVGDTMNVVASEKNARKLAEHRGNARRLSAMAKNRRRTAEDLFAAAAAEKREQALLILKADVQGSLEALRHAVENIEVDGTEVRVLHAGVGPITESDVNLASANGALLLGFHVLVDAKARSAANHEGVETELYTVIYDVLDRVEAELKGKLAPVYEEVRQGTLEVRTLFKISKIGTIAGSYVIDGKVGRNHTAKVLREGSVIWEGEVATLKRFKDDVREVSAGYECGVSLVGFNDLVEGDLIETFSRELVEP